ncbi:hypothetical protein [Comamonas avium]|uniref:Uncharacterized protein n=1 Tax=Comamonas avium TaxID=2762231 RepID=A0ABR8SGY4_9BURK|nr:hypothetical protein [Comamonas avium]MBD7962399.1 hypothetical protein [Comamonas avium]
MSKSPASIQSTSHPVSLPAFSASTLLQVLWKHAHPHLTPQELRWLAEGAPEFNCTFAQQLERVFEGVGCLVSSDGDGTAGTLQSHHDVPDLLFSHATQLGLIGSMSRIGGDAASLLQRPLN